MRSNSFHFTTLMDVFFDQFFSVTRLWRKYRPLNTTKTFNKCHKSWLKFHYTSLFFLPTIFAFAFLKKLDFSLNDHNDYWTVMPDLL